MNLRNKLILGMTLILLLVLGINTSVLMKGVTDRYKSALLVKTKVLGEGVRREVGKSLELGLSLDGLSGVNEKLKGIIEENKDIGYAMIVDSKGKILFHSDQAMVGKTIEGMEEIKTDTVITKTIGNYYETTLPLFDPEHKIVGLVKVALKAETISSQISSMLLSAIIGTVIGFIIIIGLVAFLITRFIIRPISMVSSTALEIAQGDFTKTIEINSRDELGELGEAINSMIRNLGETINRFKSAATNVSMASEQISMNSKKMAEGAKIQAEAVEKTSASIEEFNSSIKEIAESTGILSTSAEETSSSVLEIGSSIEEVAQSASALSNAISEAMASTEEIVASVKEVARSMEVLEEAISETGVAATEIDAAVRTVVENTKESARLADKVVYDASELGMVSVVDAIEGMDRVKESVRKAGESVNLLGERSFEISKIITVIDDITARTNLLALNAAILSAQAGEHGKSFSVVAEEIRDLSEKTSASTKEISSLIKTIQKETQDSVNDMKEGLMRVEEGSRLVHNVGDALREIIHSSQQSQDAVKGIETAAIEQAKGVRQVAEAVERIKDMIGQIARASHELKNGTDQIAKVMEIISDISKQVKKATQEQSKGSKQIGKVADSTADKIQLIAKAINDQRTGSETILKSINDVRTIAMDGMEIASEIDLAMEALKKEAEDLKREIERFKIK